MVDEMILKPAFPGALVRFPGTPRRVLKAEGEPVAITPFWARRIKGGDVVEVNNNKNNQEEIQ